MVIYVRNENGYIDLDNYEIIEKKTRGRKEKFWLKKDGKEYLFKTGSINYENWAELIASEIGKQIGFDVAYYDLASFQGKVGVVSPNFLKPNELIISGDVIISTSSSIIEENDLKLDVKSIHSVENVITAIDLYTDSRDTQEILKSLIELWCFDMLLLESDRNSTNWGLIKNKREDGSSEFRLTPIYDNSTIALLNNNISNYMNYLKFDGMFSKIVDSSKTSLVFMNDDKEDDFFGQFEKLCESFPSEVGDILQKFEQIDVKKVIQIIESRLNQDKRIDEDMVTVPYEVCIFVEKIVKFRLNDMKSVYSNHIKMSKN